MQRSGAGACRKDLVAQLSSVQPLLRTAGLFKFLLRAQNKVGSLLPTRPVAALLGVRYLLRATSATRTRALTLNKLCPFLPAAGQFGGNATVGIARRKVIDLCIYRVIPSFGAWKALLGGLQSSYLVGAIHP